MLPAEAPGARRAVLLAARALSLAAAALALGATGCGGDEDSSGGAFEAETADLRIELDADGPGGEPPLAKHLVCAPNADAANRGCDALLALPPDPAAPTPPGTACTEIYGGPDVLRVEGTLRGESIRAELTRGNGCEIERFDRFVPLLRDLFPGYRPGAAITG